MDGVITWEPEEAMDSMIKKKKEREREREREREKR